MSDKAAPTSKVSYHSLHKYILENRRYFHSLQQFCRNHPSILITLLYLLLSLSGIVQMVALFRHFNFDILPYLDLSDYVLAGVTFYQPLFLMIAGLLLGALFYYIHLRLLKRLRYRRWSRGRVVKNGLLAKLYFPRPQLIIPLVLLAFTVSYAWSQGNRTAAHLLHNTTAELLQVQLIYPMPFTTTPLAVNNTRLIARTYNYMFLLKDKKLLVVPNANVAAISPVPEVAEVKQEPETAEPVILPEPTQPEADEQ